MTEARVYDLWSGPRKRNEPIPPGNRWQVRWDEVDAFGRRRRPGRKFPTEAKARTFAKTINDKLDAKVSSPSTDGTTVVADLVASWQAQRHDTKRSTRDRTDRELRTWVLPRFGHREVGSIRRREVQKFANELLAGTAKAMYANGPAPQRKPLAKTSVRSILSQLRGVVEYARENDMSSVDNPVSKIKVGRIEKTKVAFLDFDEVDRLRNLVLAEPRGHQHAVLVEVMAFCGLRIGEALTLQGGDVDFVRRRIRVERSWTTEGTRWTVGSTKTGKMRFVPFSARLGEVLRPFARGAGSTGYVFPGSRGTRPEQPDNWRSRVWSKAIEGSDFEERGLTPHDLRHTAASMSIAAGADVKVVQTMLGHASPTETLDTYSHLWPDRLDDVTDKVEQARRAALGETA